MEQSAKFKAFLSQLDSGNIDNRMVQILGHIKTNPNINTDELRDQLRMAHQSLTSALSNLLDLGVVKVVGQTESENLTYSQYLYVEDEDEIIKNQKLRQKKKFNQWVKRGLRDFVEFIDENTFNQLQDAINKYAKDEKELNLENLDTNEDFIKYYSDKNGQTKLF